MYDYPDIFISYYDKAGNYHVPISNVYNNLVRKSIMLGKKQIRLAIKSKTMLAVRALNFQAVVCFYAIWLGGGPLRLASSNLDCPYSLLVLSHHQVERFLLRFEHVILQACLLSLGLSRR